MPLLNRFILAVTIDVILLCWFLMVVWLQKKHEQTTGKVTKVYSFYKRFYHLTNIAVFMILWAVICIVV